MKDKINELSNLNWNKLNGLIPVIVQDNTTLQMLMLGFMNKEALSLTCATGKVTFFSRTKNRLWLKGETSGNYLTVVNIFPDCDRDTLLIMAKPSGYSCHLERSSCFGEYKFSDLPVLTTLENIIKQRYQERPDNSYISQLFNSGTQKIAQKVGEEGVETALAGAAGDKQSLIYEASDLLFHLFVLLIQRDINLSEVLNELRGRMQSAE